jgi:hypothetical protein
LEEGGQPGSYLSHQWTRVTGLLIGTMSSERWDGRQLGRVCDKPSPNKEDPSQILAILRAVLAVLVLLPPEALSLPVRRYPLTATLQGWLPYQETDNSHHVTHIYWCQRFTFGIEIRTCPSQLLVERGSVLSCYQHRAAIILLPCTCYSHATRMRTSCTPFHPD